MTLPAMASALLVELARQDRAELAGEAVEPAGVASEIGRELVVGDHCRDRRDEAERGGEQRLGDARRDHGKAGVLGGAIAWKLFMMPHTVPKRPTNGEVEPTVARKGMKRSTRSISRLTVTCMTRSMRACRLVRNAVEAARPLAALRRHSRIAAANTADIGSIGRMPTRS